MIDLLIGVLDPNLKYLSNLDVNSILFHRLVDISGALTVIFVLCVLCAIFKVLTAFFR